LSQRLRCEIAILALHSAGSINTSLGVSAILV